MSIVLIHICHPTAFRFASRKHDHGFGRASSFELSKTFQILSIVPVLSGSSGRSFATKAERSFPSEAFTVVVWIRLHVHTGVVSKLCFVREAITYLIYIQQGALTRGESLCAWLSHIAQSHRKCFIRARLHTSSGKCGIFCNRRHQVKYLTMYHNSGTLIAERHRLQHRSCLGNKYW